jgi:hypothetical protein
MQDDVGLQESRTEDDSFPLIPGGRRPKLRFQGDAEQVEVGGLLIRNRELRRDRRTTEDGLARRWLITSRQSGYHGSELRTLSEVRTLIAQ